MASEVAGVLLGAFHYVYLLVLLWRLFRSRFSWNPRNSLLCPRRRVPRHLAIIFVADPRSSVPELESCLTKSVQNAITWCYNAGIENLTIYEEHGNIFKCLQQNHEILDCESHNGDSKVPWPDTKFHASTMTVELSDNRKKQGSWKHCIQQSNHHAGHTFRKTLTLCLASRESAKPAIGASATSLIPPDESESQPKLKHGGIGMFTLTEDKLHGLLESYTFSSPDLVVIHPTNPRRYNRTPFELHGFPPWQLKQAEIYHNRFQHPSMLMWTATGDTLFPLDERTFGQALDEFSTAEMRFGK